MSLSNIFVADTKAQFKHLYCNDLTTDNFSTENFTATNLTTDNLTVNTVATIQDLNVITNIDTSTLTTTGTATIQDLNVNTNIDTATLTATGRITAGSLFMSPTSFVNTTVPILNGGNFLLSNYVGQVNASLSGYVFMSATVLTWTFTFASPLNGSNILITPGTATLGASANFQAGQLSMCVKDVQAGQFTIVIANTDTNPYAGTNIGFNYFIF